MNPWLLWGALSALTALTLFATLNLALRIPSRVRIAAQFEKLGQTEAFPFFVSMRPQFMLATAVSRTICTLGIYMASALSVGGDPSKPFTVELIVAVAVGFVVVLIFGIAIPNAWAKYGGEALVVRLLPFLKGVRFVLLPVILILGFFDPLVRRLAGVPVRDAQSFADEIEQEILSVVSEGELHGAVDEEEKEMIESVIELADTRVEEIMTPRTEMAAIPADADYDTVLAVVRDKGHSRIPVYDQTIDTILGVLYVKDLLRINTNDSFSLRDTMRKPLFIPESKPVRELLREFQASKVHIAVVLDEYGGTAGLVTIEDILEELVGEINDEYDSIAPTEFQRIDDHTVEVDARMRVEDLNNQFELTIPEDEDFETIGGFVFSKLGRIPETGETLDYQNISLKVITAEPRRIRRLRLTLLTQGSPQPEEKTPA